MKQPLISVIIPIYNEEKYIDQCVAGIVAQTYENIELILVEGGSDDNSAEICDAWLTKWASLRQNGDEGNISSIRVLHVDNKGVSYSRNCGIETATGEYITFVDGDDCLKSDAIQIMYEAMIESDADMSGIDFESFYSHDETLNNTTEIKPTINLCTPKEFLSNNVLDGDTHAWGRLYKRELISGIRFKQGLTVGEDVIFLIEYVLSCRTVCGLNYKGYNYFRNPVGAMSKPFSPSAMDQIKCWEIIRELLGDSPKLRKNMLISVMLTASRIACMDKEHVKAAGEYIDSLQKTLRKYKSREAFGMLSAGYKIKVILFDICPSLYVWLYGINKR